MSPEQTVIHLDHIRLARSVAGLTAGAGGARFLLSIESPKPGRISPSAGLQLSGWVIPLGEPLQSLRLTAPGGMDIEVSVAVDRPDVVRNLKSVLPDRELPAVCGFNVCILPWFLHSDFDGRERVYWRLEGMVAGEPVPLASFCGQGASSRASFMAGAERFDERPVVIAGFHRSGTSALASLLADAGMGVGNELVPPQISNPDGHFEDCWAVDIDTAILNHNGQGWTYAGDGLIDSTTEHASALEAYVRRRSHESRSWAVKDPRAGLLLSQWSAALPSLRAVAPVRHAEECARSLRRRQAAAIVRGVDPAAIDEALRFWHDPDLPYRMWASHHAALLHEANRRPGKVTFVAQRELLRDPAGILQALDCRPATDRAAREGAARVATGSSSAAVGISPATLSHVNELARRMQAVGGGDVAVIMGDPPAAQESALLQRIEELAGQVPFSGVTPVSWTQEATATGPAPMASGVEQVRALAERGNWLEAQWQLRSLAATAGNPGGLELLRARVFAALGRWSDALSVHGRMLSANPRQVDAILGAAECLLMQGEFADAIDMVRQFLRVGAAEPWGWQRCARTVTRLNDSRLALEFGERLSQACDRSSANWLAVCGLYEMRRGHATAANAWIDQAAAREPSTPLVHEALQERHLRQGEPMLAARVHASVFARSHDRAGYLRYIQRVCARVPAPAWRAALLGDIVEELALLARHFAPQRDAAAESRPAAPPAPREAPAETATAAIDRASTLFRADRYDEASDAVKQVLQREPAHLAALEMLRTIHARTGRSDAVIPYAEAAAACSPADLRVQLLRADIMVEGGQARAAAAQLRDVASRSNNPSAWVALSRAVAADGDREAALRISEEAIAACPGAHWVWLRHLRMLDTLGRRSELEQQLAARPAPPVTDGANFVPWTKVMLALSEHRRVKQVIDACSEAAKEALSSAKGTSDLLFDLTIRLGQPSEAVEIIRNELARNKNDPRLLRRLFDLALWTGEVALAEIAAARLHRLDPMTHGGLPMFLLHEARIFQRAMRHVHEVMHTPGGDRLRQLSEIVVAEPGCLPAAFAWMNQFVAERAASDERRDAECGIPRVLLHDKPPTPQWREQHANFEWIDFSCEQQLRTALDALPAATRMRLARIPKLPLLDIARLAMVKARGGWWVNPTVDCRAPVNRLGGGASVVLSLDDSGWLTDAPLGSVADEPVIARALDVALTVGEEVLVRENASPLTTGMPALTLGLASALAPRVLAGESLDHVSVTTPIQRWRRLGLWWPE